jgi:hypothetical protein
MNMHDWLHQQKGLSIDHHTLNSMRGHRWPSPQEQQQCCNNAYSTGSEYQDAGMWISIGGLLKKKNWLNIPYICLLNNSCIE